MQPVLLLPDGNDQVRVWLNGKEPFAGDRVGTCQVGQHRIPATPTQGWNQIMIKVVQAEVSEWDASLRVLQPDGSSLPQLRMCSDNVKIE